MVRAMNRRVVTTVTTFLPSKEQGNDRLMRKTVFHGSSEVVSRTSDVNGPEEPLRTVAVNSR